MSKTITLECAKKLHEILPDVVSERWWYKTTRYEEKDTTTSLKTYRNTIVTWVVGTAVETMNEKIDSELDYPALNLQEVLDALPDIGKVMGWSREYLCRWYEVNYLLDLCLETKTKKHTYHAHIILEAYLRGGMEKVSEYLLSVINKK